MAQLLLAKGAAVNATDGEGRMPLHWAALLGRSSVAELLLAMNATVDAEDREGGEPWVGGGDLAFSFGPVADVGRMADIKVASRFISSYLTFGECTDEVSEGFGKFHSKAERIWMSLHHFDQQVERPCTVLHTTDIVRWQSSCWRRVLQ